MWKVEYYTGSEWAEKNDAVFKKIHQELNGHEECLFILPNTSDNRIFVSSDKKIRILYGSEVIFEGFLVGAEYSEDLLVCFAYPEAYVRMDPRIIPSGSSYTVEYIGETISNVLQAICDEAGVEKGECPSGTVSVRFIRSNCLKAAQFLADAVNKDFWADWDASLNPRFNIGTRQEHSNVPVDPLEWPKRTVDRSQKITKVIVRSVDEDGNYIEGSAGTGDKIAVFTEKGAMDIDTLNTLAQKKLDELNTESSGVTLPLKVTQGYNLYPGDTVKLNKPELGWESEVTYRVLAVTKTIDKVKIEVEKKVKTLDKELEDFKKYEEYGIYPIYKEQAPSMENYFDKTEDDVTDIPDYIPAPPTFIAEAKEIDTELQFRTWIEVTINVVENAGGYIVSYRREGDSEWQHIPVEQPSSGSQVKVATPNLESDTIYEVHACTLSKLGQASDWSSTVTVDVGHTSNAPDNPTGHNDAAPPQPTGLSKIETLNGVILEWSPVSASDFSHYKVYYGTSDPPDNVAGEISRPYFFWKKKDSEAYTTYYFAVSAVDSAGNESSKSGTVSAQPLQVGTPDIAPDAVTAEKILDGAVSDVKLASGAVTLAKFASGLRPVQIVDVLPPLPHSDYPEGAVVFLTSDNKLYRSTGTSWTAKIATSDLVGQITETQIADNAISTPKLQANAVEADKIAANAVTSEKIAANAVEAGKIAAGAVSTNELAAGAVTAEKIQAGAVDASKLTVAQIFVDGLTFTDNSPSSGYISWSSCKVYYQGDEYSISSGNTNKKYIYWQVGYSTFATSDIKPDWSDTLFLIAINENGKHKTVWNATLIHGGSIITGTITSEELVTDQAVITNSLQIGSGIIINDHIAEIEADKIHLDGSVYLSNWRHGSDMTKIDGGKIYTGSIKADQIDTGAIKSQHIEFDAVNSDAEEPTKDRTMWYREDLDQLRFRGTGGKVGYIPRYPLTQDSAPPENLVPNQCFEIDRDGDNVPDYWRKEVISGSGSVGLTSEGRKGKYCLTIYASNGKTRVGSALIPVTPNTKYYVRVFVKHKLGETNLDEPLITVGFFDRSGLEDASPVWSNIGSNVTQDYWIKKEGTVTVPDGKYYAAIYCQVSIDSGYSMIYFDNVTFSEIRAMIPTNKVVATSVEPTAGAGNVGTSWTDCIGFTIPSSETWETYFIHVALSTNDSITTGEYMKVRIKVNTNPPQYFPDANGIPFPVAYATGLKSFSGLITIPDRSLAGESALLQAKHTGSGTVYTHYAIKGWGHSPHYHR